jgi:hypothetical protein
VDRKEKEVDSSKSSGWGDLPSNSMSDLGSGVERVEMVETQNEVMRDTIKALQTQLNEMSSFFMNSIDSARPHVPAKRKATPPR